MESNTEISRTTSIVHHHFFLQAVGYSRISHATVSQLASDSKVSISLRKLFPQGEGDGDMETRHLP